MKIEPVEMDVSFPASDIVFIEELQGVETIPYDTYFQRVHNGEDMSALVPNSPLGGTWSHGEYKGQTMLFSQNSDELYMLIWSTNFGYALMHYVYTCDAQKPEYTASNTYPARIIKNERRHIHMSAAMDPNGAFAQLTQMSAQNNSLAGAATGGNTELRQLNLPTTNTQPNVLEGVTGASVDVRKILSELRACGYVAGYVMKNAPAINIRFKKEAKGSSIRATESKPSVYMGIAMSLPSRCVMSNGVLAMPTAVARGNVDYNHGQPGQSIKMVFNAEAAKSYIFAAGGSLPEFAPLTSGRKTHWSPEDVVSGSPDVTFVTLRPSSKSAGRSVNDLRYVLRTTSSRGSLLTPNNVVCLRALTQTSALCTTEAEEYLVNESAFGRWRNRRPKGTTVDMLSTAIEAVPTLLWSRKYTIEGETVNGVGSAFFLSKDSVTDGNGNPVMRRTLEYCPWDRTSDRKKQAPEAVTNITLYETYTKADEVSRGTRTKPITLRESPKNPLFAPYRGFLDRLVQENYISLDELYSLCGRTQRKRSSTPEFSPADKDMFQNYMNREDIRDAIQNAVQQTANRAIINESRNWVS